MKGIPENLQTRQDWLNAYQYALDHFEAKRNFKHRLEMLLQSRSVKVLKNDVRKSPEELSPKDFEDQEDPRSPFFLSGLSESEIKSMLEKL
ncbi:hypothetical protein [Gracilinema caldarium]|uniref:hypothetical protein n=1 Tax=Gracilinema caldarium TaxID=215591 RepID=UPI0026EA3BC3|nr:hypothetical protein [Gracilinema caldarium]